MNSIAQIVARNTRRNRLFSALMVFSSFLFGSTLSRELIVLETAEIAFNCIATNIQSLLVRGDYIGMKMLLNSVVEHRKIDSIGVAEFNRHGKLKILAKSDSVENPSSLFNFEDDYESTSLILKGTFLFYPQSFLVPVDENYQFKVIIINRADIAAIFALLALTCSLLVATFVIFENQERRSIELLSNPLLDLSKIIRKFGEGEKKATKKPFKIKEFRDIESQLNVMWKMLKDAEKNREAAAIDRAVAEMTRFLAHEGRKPVQMLLSAVTVMNQFLKKGEVLQALNVFNEYAPCIDRLSQGSTNLFGQIMAFHFGEHKLVFSMSDLSIIIRDTVSSSVKSKEYPDNLTVVFNFMHEYQCEINVPTFGFAISNIVDNALDAMSSHCWEESEDPVLWINTRIVRKNFFEIEIGNTGPIIPEQEIKLMFQKFHTGKIQGFGLGLPIAKRMIGYHRGKLSCSSCKEGTRFLIEFSRKQGKRIGQSGQTKLKVEDLLENMSHGCILDLSEAIKILG